MKRRIGYYQHFLLWFIVLNTGPTNFRILKISYMNYILRDPVLSILSKVMCSTLPFLTMGILYSQKILCVFSSIAFLALLIFLIRSCCLILKQKLGYHQPGWILVVEKILGLPYAMLLSSTILILRGIDAYIGVWFAVLMSLFFIIGYVIPTKSDVNDK